MEIKPRYPPRYHTTSQEVLVLTHAPPNDLGESRYRKEINYIEGVMHPQFLIGHGHFEDWTASFPKLDSVDAKK